MKIVEDMRFLCDSMGCSNGVFLLSTQAMEEYKKYFCEVAGKSFPDDKTLVAYFRGSPLMIEDDFEGIVVQYDTSRVKKRKFEDWLYELRLNDNYITIG